MNPATADLFRDEIARLQAENELLDAAHKASNSAMLVIESGFKNALSEIALLRSQPCPYVTGNVTKHCTLTPFTLTDAERKAVKDAIGWIESPSVDDEAMPEDYLPITATLRGLLERTGVTEHARSTAANKGGGEHERRE